MSLDSDLDDISTLIDDLRDEITRLRALVADLKDALETLQDVQNGPPLITWTERWNNAMAKAKSALEKE